MRRSFHFLAMLACAMPLACSDSSNTPTAPAPLPSFSANPASNGSIVAHWDGWAGWMSVGWYDAGPDMIALLATGDVPSMCADRDPAFVASDWKFVASGRHEQLYHSIATFPEMYIFIYDGGLSTWDICQPPIMTGMGTARLTDSDRTVDGSRATNGAHAFGLMASGQVSDGHGQTYRFSGHVRSVENPDGTERQETLINLQPLH